jgi:hypothetical protein
MGGGQVTVSNLEVVEVDASKNEIFIKGAVPGAIGNLLMIAGDGEFEILSDMPAVETPVAAEAEAAAVEPTEAPAEKEAEVTETTKE